MCEWHFHNAPLHFVTSTGPLAYGHQHRGPFWGNGIVPPSTSISDWPVEMQICPMLWWMGVASPLCLVYTLYLPLCLGVSSLGMGQHCQRTCGGMCIPVAARKVSTRLLIYGTRVLPLVVQDQPTEASTMHWREHMYASIQCCLSSSSQSSHSQWPMLSKDGIRRHIGGPTLMPNATQTKVCRQGVSLTPHCHLLGAAAATRNPAAHLYMNAGAPSSILRPEFLDLEVVPILQPLGSLPWTPSTCLSSWSILL